MRTTREGRAELRELLEEDHLLLVALPLTFLLAALSQGGFLRSSPHYLLPVTTLLVVSLFLATVRLGVLLLRLLLPTPGPPSPEMSPERISHDHHS